MTKAIDALVAAVCGTDDHPLAGALGRWCNESRPFTAFVQTYATKIHKKARLAAEQDTLPELLAELAVAALLVNDRRCAVAYEAAAGLGGRSPDFSVTWKTHTLFHVEVTHLRAALADGESAAPLRLARVVCDKLGQFPAGAMNALLVVVPPEVVERERTQAAMRLLDERAQQGDDAFFHTRRLGSVAAYTRQRPRLSAIALRAFAEDWTPLAAALWANPQAKHPLQPAIARLLCADSLR